MPIDTHSIVERVSSLFQTYPVALVLLVALVLAFILRLVLLKGFKLVLNLLFFVLIYLLVLLGLSYIAT